MNLGSQRMMKMGCVVREPLHGLAAQLREASIFEGEPQYGPPPIILCLLLPKVLWTLAWLESLRLGFD